MDNVWEERLGKVEFIPNKPVAAGSHIEWVLTYTVGSYGIDEGGVLMLVKRLASDMEHPQFDRPRKSGYTTITTDGKCRLVSRFQKKQHPRPWHTWVMVIDITDGYLAPGDMVKVILGDRSHGSPGIRAQSFIESRHEFRWLVDPTNAVDPRRLPSSPVISVVAGEPVRLICTLPSLLATGETGRFFLKGEDFWGNPTLLPEGIKLSAIGSAEVKIEDDLLRAETPGTAQLKVKGNSLSCLSNPLVIIDQAPEYRPFWADLHGQTENTVGTGSNEEFFDFAKLWGHLDVVGHQGNDFQITPEAWQELNNAIKIYERKHNMVILPGFEWSGNTSAGGDHNVYFLEDDPPILRSCHWQVPQVPEDELSPAHPANVLFSKLKKLQGFHSLVIPHVGGRYADTKSYFDPELESVVEIVSCWGIFEWLLWDALEAGHRVGIVCNSDGHAGRPGAEGPGAGHFGVKGGLTCIFAEKLTRKAIFDALKERRCYGTTGPRISLWVEADGHPMGTEFSAASQVNIIASVQGTGPLESLTLNLGPNEVYQVMAPEFSAMEGSVNLRVFWEGALIRGRARQAIWDGEITVEGAEILSAKTYAFDSPAEGITDTGAHLIKFCSRTVGDRDGIELRLDQARNGRLNFKTPIGKFSVELAELEDEPCIFNYGGIGLKAGIYRYPEKLSTKSLRLEHTVTPTQDTQPYLVKARQADGHMAWSSPVFIKRSG